MANGAGQSSFGGGYGGQGGQGFGGGYGQQSNPFGGGQGFGGGYGGQGGYGGGQGFGGGYGGQGGFGGGYGGGQGYGGGFQPQGQSPFGQSLNSGYGNRGGFGGGFNPMQGYGGQNQTPAFAQSYMGNMGQMASQQADIAAQRQYAQPGQDYRTVSPQQISQMQNQQPAFLQDQEFQGYRQQQEDLSRQMNEYMQKAPMYQQLQDLQGKMRGVQDRYAPQQNQQGRGQSYEDYLNGPMPAALGYKRMTREEFDAQQTGRLQGGLGTQQQAQDALRQALGGAPRQAQFGQAALGGLSQLLRGQLG